LEVKENAVGIWKKTINMDDIDQWCKNNMVEHIGIRITDVGDDYIKATMPVDHRTHQPMGILHGGASVVLAETLGSIAANLAVKDPYYCVGMEINANHIKSAFDDYVTGTVNPVHIGKSTHVWDITIRDKDEELICVSRITLAVLK
jgi:1,4-dihydroxy-2-naphthoyl-CoA hydrolase